MSDISVGKNVVRILGREFPIDRDLSFVKILKDQHAWHVDSTRQDHRFRPVDKGEVSIDTFRTYQSALKSSKAFKHNGKVRQLFDRKEEGVKIVPGHGVFILPSKMRVDTRDPRSIKISVFAGTHLSRTFQSLNYSRMVLEAANHYFDHFREFTDSVNKSLYHPVKYNRQKKPTFMGVTIPSGVFVYMMEDGKRAYVQRHSVSKEQNVWVGVAKNSSELQALVVKAEGDCYRDQTNEAVYRFVNPSFVTLSNYMRRV